jgi:4-hydroxy-2-oxoheptanedioate aldolase
MNTQNGMRRSRVLEKLRSGGIATCVKLNISDHKVAELASLAGFDCVWTDMEHVGSDWSAIEKQILTAKVYDVDTLVRVARGSYSDHIRPLEMDASGIMVPHVMNLEDAKKVVMMTKFHPVGRRPLDGGNADGSYCRIPLADYIKQANDNRFVMIQIEDPEPLDELEQIIALEGIDIVFFGPGDFSQGIGTPGEFDSPLLLKTRERIASLCKKHGKFAGTVGGMTNISDLADLGYSFISVGADVVGLGEYFVKVMEAFGKNNIKQEKGIYGR